MHRLSAALGGRSRGRAGGLALCLAAACLVFASSPPAASAAGTRYLDEVFASVTTTSNLTYDTVINYDNTPIDVKLDVYQPTGDSETNRPVVMYIHGGYFAAGDKSEGSAIAQEAARRGYVAVSINYRVWPGAATDGTKLLWGINAAQRDAQSAVRWLRKNAESLGINPLAIFAMGYSAGAITSLQVDYQSASAGGGGNQGFASDIAGAVSMAGFAFGSTPRSAPVIMFNGTADPLVQYSWATATCSGAVANGDSCTLYSYPGAGHDLSPYFDDIKPKIWAFLYSLVPGVLTLPAPMAGFHGLSPARLLDTRDGTGVGTPAQVPAGGVVNLAVAGQGSVPASGVSAVVLNVTGVNPSAYTHVTVFPGGTARPATSNLNLVPGQTVANLVTTGVGSDGSVDFFNNDGTIDLVADVVGYFDDGTGAGDRFNAIAPTRVLDTRDGTGGFAGRLQAGSPIAVAVGATPSIPADAVDAVMNLTVVGGSENSHVTAWPAGESMPGVSNLNFVAGQTLANAAALKLGTAGQVSLANNAGGVYAIVDATGYFKPTGNRFVAVQPTRVLDTRNGTGASGPVAAGTSIDVFIKGAPGLPPDGISGVVINVTAVGATTPTHVTAWPTGSPMPGSSTLNVANAAALPNLAMLGVGPGGQVSIYNNSGSTHLVGDVVGYFV
ncbi:MAG: alpha/beta hydrolase [Actinobacteria bacterium]|nr:alpha/beta hydrolase [Actinomycetota bacterium]